MLNTFESEEIYYELHASPFKHFTSFSNYTTCTEKNVRLHFRISVGSTPIDCHDRVSCAKFNAGPSLGQGQQDNGLGLKSYEGLQNEEQFILETQLNLKDRYKKYFNYNIFC